MNKGSPEQVGERDEAQGVRSAEAETVHVVRRGFKHRATQRFTRVATCSGLPKLFLLLLALLPLKAHAFEEVQEGLWELTAVMHVDGQSYGPYTQKQCITKKDLQNPALLFGEGAGTCDFTNKRFFINEFSFNVRCNTGIPLTGTGKVEFGADWVKGNMDLTAQVPGGASVDTSSEMSGKRLGDCSK